MYFILKAAVATRETGSEFPQAQEMVEPYDYDAPDGINVTAEFEGTDIPFGLNLNTIKVRSVAKMTDLLSVAMIGTSGIFISAKLQTLLSNFNLVPHKLYSSKVQHKKQIHEDYAYMHFASDLRDFVDYPKSKFYARIPGLIEDDLNFKTKEDTLAFYERVDKFHLLQTEYIVLNPMFFEFKYDLFYISNFDKNIYISERLRDSLLENRISGIDIVPTEKIRVI
jgi:hypothetical protein